MPDGGKLSSFEELIREWVFGRFGVIGLIILALLVAAAYV
jgi:hypothetical protein